MKVGDLVRWTYPGHETVGIAIEPWHDYRGDEHMIIHWIECPQCDGPYRVDHEYLELISEGR